MKNWADIFRVLRLLAVLLPIILVLPACSGEEGSSATSDYSAVDKTANPEALSEQQRECWQSEIIGAFYDTMSKTTMDMYSQITFGALPFMMVAFALWFAHRLLLHVSSVVEENPNEVWNEVFRKMFICFACGYLASSIASIIWFLNVLVFPIYSAFLEFGSEILNNASLASSKHQGDVKIFGETLFTTNSIICKFSGQPEVTISNGFPQGPKDMMECMICAVNERLNLGFKLSYTVMQAPGFMATLLGIFILLCFTFVKLGFVFYLVDTIFKFTVMAILLPLLIMAAAFKNTRGWLKTGILSILNSAAFMMFISIVMAMTLMAIEQVIANNPAIFAGDDPQTFKELSIPFLCLMMIAFLLISAMGVAQKVTSSLVGGGTSAEFNKKVTMVASMIANTVGSWLTFGTSTAVRKAVDMGKAAAGGGKNIAQKAYNKVKRKKDGK